MRNRMGSSLNLDTTVVGLQGHPISSVAPAGGQALVFDGTDWVPTTVQVTSPPPAVVGPTPPAGPGIGDLWFNNSTGVLNVWDGTAWVPTYIDNDPYLPLAGGTLTGPLVLVGDAASALQPVTLQQLNSAIAALPTVPATVADVPIVFFFPGLPAANFNIPIPIVIPLQIPTNAAGAAWTAAVFPAADTVFNLYQLVPPSTSNFLGRVTAHSDGTATWSVTATALAPGNILSLTAPSPPDTALSGPAFTILATRA